MRFFRRYAFTFWLLFAVALGIVFPGPASEGGLLRPEITTKLGVWFIFLLQGLSLSGGALLSGYRPKRLHGFVLTWNYLLFPFVTVLLMLPLAVVLPAMFLPGFWFLSILPTTIASAVTFATLAGGNAPNAIFSTVLSNFIGIFLVPVAATVYLAAEASIEVNAGPLFLQLVLLILVPLVIGQLIRRAMPRKADVFSKKTKIVSRGIIVYIVYAAFSRSMASGFLESLGAGSLLTVLVGTICLLAAVSALVWLSSGVVLPSYEHRITAFFCGSQKSLATGLPLATSILAAIPDGALDPAVLLIPLLCYHGVQLMFAGWLVEGRIGEEG
ncbi:MAG: bile acid:sodium symporter [Opitutales bacterium]